MNLATPQETTVQLNDCVRVEGRRGTVLGLYAHDVPTVLVRLDLAGLIEVAESRVVVEGMHDWARWRRAA